jgi:hypothetical protein
MAVLYKDQFDAITGLGTDEKFVLAHIAHGYSEQQIIDGLAKRGDRDSQDDMPQIMRRVYAKLGIADGEKPSTKWVEAGKLYLSYTEMGRDKVGPRPGKAPVQEPPKQRVDDMPVIPEPKRAEPPAHRNGVFQGAEHANGFSAPPPRPAPQPPASAANGGATGDAGSIASYARHMNQLKKKELDILEAFHEKNDVAYVARKVSLAAGTIHVRLSGIFAKLGDRSHSKGKIDKAIAAFRLFKGIEAPARAQEPADDAPTARTEPSVPLASRRDKEKASAPTGMVVDLTDPAAITDVECAVSKQEKQTFYALGYRLEHVVVPESAGPDARPITYVFVKRR